MSINVLYEDNHLIVIEKPVNVPSQKDETGDPDVLAIMKDDLKKRYGKPGNVYLGLVHRLDRPVGGVMVLAKTSKAASRLSAQIRAKEFKKTYLAVIHGTPAVRRKLLKHYLVKDSRTNTVRVTAESSGDAKEAVLEYRVMAASGELSLVGVELHTGRPHQIRVQFSETGHPLYGDQKYGAEKNKPGQQIALWSYRVVCKHPTKDEILTFTSLPPAGKYPWELFDINKLVI